MSSLLKSAYELARDERIKRNKKLLASFGVDEAKEQLAPAPAEAHQPKKKREVSTVPTAPSRMSKRIKGEAAAFQPHPKREDGTYERTSVDDRGQKVRYTVDDAVYDELVRIHQSKADSFVADAKLDYREALALTYHRVRSMSEQALMNRVKSIERSAGQNSLQKMRVFAEVLIVEGLDEVAPLAEAALERLLALPKFKSMFIAYTAAAAEGTPPVYATEGELPVCIYGAGCYRKTNETHLTQFRHPDLEVVEVDKGTVEAQSVKDESVTEDGTTEPAESKPPSKGGIRGFFGVAKKEKVEVKAAMQKAEVQNELSVEEWSSKREGGQTFVGQTLGMLKEAFKNSCPRGELEVEYPGFPTKKRSPDAHRLIVYATGSDDDAVVERVWGYFSSEETSEAYRSLPAVEFGN